MDLLLGRDAKTNKPVYLSAGGARAVLICGKRGSGKSYALGVWVEELLNVYGQDVVPIIIDPIGVYHTMSLSNDAESEPLYRHGLSPRGWPVRLLVPGEPTLRYDPQVLEAMQRRNIALDALRFNACDLSPDGWCDLFGVSVNQPSGIVLYRAVQWLTRQAGETYPPRQPFTVQDIADAVQADGLAIELSQQALMNRLEAAHSWRLFNSERVYVPLEATFVPGAVNVVDLSRLDPGARGLRNLVVSVIARNLFRARADARLREAFGLAAPLPRVWLCLDEAHQFVPSGGSTLSKEVLIRWVKEGRQPGLSTIIATQQPSAVDWDVLSQCDVILGHKLTTKADVNALNALSHDYMPAELKAYIKELERVGQAVLVDDEREQVTLLHIRPRQSRHGGSAAGSEKEWSIWDA